MSTRSRTRTGLSSKGSTASQSKQKGRSKHHDDMDIDSQDEESLQTPAKSSALKKGKGKQDSVRGLLRPIDCTCAKGDDGSPMIQCSECRIWYHFTCVELSEPEAEEINIYVCPTCTSSTHRRSTMTWEGTQANEECIDDEAAVTTRRKAAVRSRTGRRTPERRIMPEESEESSSSEDEYVEVKREHVEQTKTTDKRALTVSDTDSADESRKRRLSRTKIPPSPAASLPNNPALKRKAPHSNISQTSPAHKRKRSTDSQGNTATDDPARKYCLGKLEELFRDVFLRYPHVRTQVSSVDANTVDAEESKKNVKSEIVPKELGALSEEEKELLLSEARQFAHDLESCVFDIYSEPDKNGHSHAGGKYKERFRMLQFNLSKVDRVIIHQRITSGNISAKEISLMSSTDLADEETKQSIKLAEKEALEHSILLKSSAPRAKITHKGLQDIEDVNGEVATAQQIERLKEREQEEDERRERELLARLRTVQRQRTSSISVPPESPIVSSGEYQWGAPPPVPPHAMSPAASDSDESQSQVSRPSLFLQTSSEANIAEPELNLADLINIDGEQDSAHPSPIQQSTNGAQADASSESKPSAEASRPSPIPPTPTGISPFAARPERMRGASFDLSSIWNAPKVDTESGQDTVSVPASTPAGESPADGSDKDEAMDLESVEANDQDFDMFLDENRVESPSDDLIVTPLPLKEVESLPQVWTGKIAMPLDSSVPQETYLVARQVAGRPIPPESPLWRTLFPSEQLRIEGRVPVENSVKYLMQMRFNATKELFAAAFIPASTTNTEDFKTFCNFLISKSRHGLVFPWGNRPKDYHPGRELYMIPLLQSEPLPEFVELLDDLRLPKTRTKDYLLGIWILNKGKLAVLPNATAPPAPAPQPAQQMPRIPAIPPAMFNTPPPPRIPQALPVPTPPLPPTIPSLPPIVPAALAAEVASLTPEQLQEVLRTLAATAQIPLPPPAGHIPQPQPPPQFNQNRPFPPHVPTPPMGSHIPPGLQNTQPWMHPPPPPPLPGQYPINYPPPNIPYQQPPHGPNSPSPAIYDRPDYDRDFRPVPHYPQGGRGAHDERGWRGNPNNRGGPGRGRGRGDGQDRDFNARRSSDSGWPRRRNDNQGGPSW